jgi:hypothetical protein
MSNSELWVLAEQGNIEQWSCYQDQEGNEIIWTGKSFQSNTDIDDKYIGMCLGDKWTFVGIEEQEDEE